MLDQVLSHTNVVPSSDALLGQGITGQIKFPFFPTTCSEEKRVVWVVNGHLSNGKLKNR